MLSRQSQGRRSAWVWSLLAYRCCGLLTRRRTDVHLEVGSPDDMLRIAAEVVDCAISAESSICGKYGASDLARIERSSMRLAESSWRPTIQPPVSFFAGPHAPTKVSKSVAVVSVCVPDAQGSAWDRLCAVARHNFEKYCDAHGYTLMFADKNHTDMQGRNPKWQKIRALQDALRTPGIEYAFWMDSDSLFMNVSTTLDGLLPTGDKMGTICGDLNCFLNNGHFVLRNDNRSLAFLDKVWGIYPPPEPWSDQGAMVFVMGGSKPECRHVSLPRNPHCCSPAVFQNSNYSSQFDMLEPRAMNSYMANFKPGDLVLHFAGSNASQKADLMERFARLAHEPVALGEFSGALHDVFRRTAP